MWVSLAVIAIALLAGIMLYNRLIRGRSLVLEGWSGIDVQLKRRFELIPNFVETVKDFKAFEQGLLERVVQLRGETVNKSGVADRGQAEGRLTSALANVLVVAEDYPELKSSESFLALQKQLVEVEDQIQYARRYYNGAVRDMNIKVQSFPSNLIAKMFGFTEMEYFQLDHEDERIVPKVAL